MLVYGPTSLLTDPIAVLNNLASRAFLQVSTCLGFECSFILVTDTTNL